MNDDMKHHQSDGCPETAYPDCIGRLARIEQKLDTLCSASSDKESRIRALEDGEAQRKGAWKLTLAISGAIGGIVAAIVSWLLSTTKHP